MSVIYECEVELDFDFDAEKEIIRTIDACLDYLKCPYECEVSVLLTDNETIHELNKENRNIDRPTDVLSFPMCEYDEPANFDFSEEDEITVCNPETGELMLGDIVISIDKVKEQAKEYGHSEKREILFLVAHSMLHLAGFDHEEEAEREEMERMQREILNSIGVTR